MPAPGAFLTDDGRPMPALTTEEMREVDRAAIEEGGPNLFQMMENAGRNLALTAIDLLGPIWQSATVVVLAGTGGNGGGGITAGRHLANRGVAVALVVTSPERLQGVPEAQFGGFRRTGGRVLPVAHLGRVRPHLVIDAVIGYSLVASPRGAARELIGYARAADCPVLSLDVPSGLDATTGSAPGEYVEATSTLTLALPKTGLWTPSSGSIVLADIGIPPGVYDSVGLEVPDPLFDHRYRIPLVRA